MTMTSAVLILTWDVMTTTVKVVVWPTGPKNFLKTP